MTIALSSTALSQISNHDVKKYVECKLYNTTGTYLRDILVQNASYSKSRQFAVNSMNIQVPNTDKIYTSGQFEIKQDYIIVLIEGYDTGIESDKIPTFRGRVKELNHTQSGDNDVLNITVYGEIMLLQRSDLNKVYVADTEYVVDEKLVPIIDNPAADIAEVYTIGSKEYIKILYNGYSYINTLITEQLIYVGNNALYIQNKPIIPLNVNITTNGVTSYRVYFTGSNTFTLGETIKTSDGTTFTGIYRGEGTFGMTGDKFLILDTITGKLSNGLVLIGDSSGGTITTHTFYLLDVINFNNNQSVSQVVNVGDKVHNGVIDKFRAQNTNWAGFTTHKINIKNIEGDPSAEDKYDGYEISESLGILKLNKPVKITEYDVYASYRYYPQGLFVEDVITDLLTEKDALSIDIINDGIFHNASTYWTVSGSGVSSSDYILKYESGINITTYNTFGVSDYISVKQVVSLLSGYSYNIRFNIEQKINVGAIAKLYINNSEILTVTDFESLKSSGVTYNSTLSDGSYDYEIRLFNMDINSIVRINDIKINYNPSKINTFTESNLYCKLSNEDGAAVEYNLSYNSDYSPIPRYKILTDYININSTLITLNNVTDLESSGYVKINDEIISYSSIIDNDLVISNRGVNSTDITTHVTGKRVYQTMEPYRVWHLPYNNIIPETVDSTASDYGYTGAINIVSGNFTISGANFYELFYREGIIITDAVASAVILNSGTDYTFNQIQSTGIETSYILIDYKKILNKYDALNEIRSMLAPNFIIDEIVRKDGSDYNTFIRGRYLAQKALADYNLDFITSVVYSKPTNNYNRVKMFGKLSNPKNLMYSDSTHVYTVNDFGAQYVQGVGYKYSQQIGNEYVFTNGLSLHVNEWKYSNDGGATWSRLIYKNLMYRNSEIIAEEITGTYNKISTSYGYYFSNRPEIYHDAVSLNSLVNVKYNGTNYISYMDTVFEWHVDSGKYWWQSYVSTYYNPYLVSSNDTNFAIGDVINDGVNSGTVKLVFKLGQQDDYIISVEHDRTSDVFSNASTITNGTSTATAYHISLGGITAQINFNALPTPMYGDVLRYNFVYSNFNDNSINFTTVQSDTVLYIDDLEVTKNNSFGLWSEQLLNVKCDWTTGTIQDGVFGTKYRGRGFNFDNSNIYINKSSSEYFDTESRNISYGSALAGTVRFEYHDTTNGKVNVLYTLRYIDEPGIDTQAQSTYKSPYGKLSDMLYNASIGYMAKDASAGQADGKLAQAIRDCTHIRFYTRYDYDVKYRVEGDCIYINKKDLDSQSLLPQQIKVSLDGEFIVNIPDTYYDKNISTITRLRNNYTDSRDTQVSIVSKTPINELDLFVIDLGYVTKISLIDLQAGFLYKPVTTGDNDKYPVTFKTSVYYSTKNETYSNVNLDTDFELISDNTDDIEMGNGNVISLTSTELGEYFEARYLKVRVSTGNEYDSTFGIVNQITINNKEIENRSGSIDYYGASIASIAIYENDTIVSEKYTDADVINLYKDTTVYEQLYNQELVDSYAQANLYEFQKDGTTVVINSPIGSHYDIGMTVNLNDEENSIDKNYFIEEVNTQNGAVTLSIARYE